MKTKYLMAGLVLVLSFVVLLGFVLDRNFLQRAILFREQVKFFSWEQLWPFFNVASLKTYNLQIPKNKLVLLTEHHRHFMNSREGRKLKVQATLVADGRELPVTVTYRGYNPAYWTASRKSFRLKTKSAGGINGLSSINLIMPEQRSYLNDAFGNHLAEKLGLLSPAWDFVRLYLNGEYQGVFYVLEQINSEALELRGLADSRIWTEQNLSWDAGLAPLFDNPARLRSLAGESETASLDAGAIKILTDALGDPDDESFAAKIREIVDWENFSRWQAHQVLLSSAHQGGTHNNRILWDHVSGKLQFIPTDLQFGTWDLKDINVTGHPLVERALKIPDFRRQRDRLLWRYVQNDDNLRADLAFLDELFNRTKRAFWEDSRKPHSNLWFNAHHARCRALYENRYKDLQRVLKNCDVACTILVGEAQTGRIASLFLGTPSLPGAFLSGMRVSLKKGLAGTWPKELLVFREGVSEALPSRQDQLVGRLLRVGKTPVYKGMLSELIPSGIRLSVLGQDNQIRTWEPAFRNSNFYVTAEDGHPGALPQLLSAHLRIVNAVTDEKARSVVQRIDLRGFSQWEERLMSVKEFSQRYPFLLRDTENPGRFIWPSGTYVLNRNMVIPAGMDVHFAPGVRVQLKQGVSILCFGEVQARGTKSLPITFQAFPGDGPWGVFALVGNAGGTADFRHCHFKDGGSVYWQGLNLTGNLSCYDRDVLLGHCQFLNNQGEDAVNCKRGRVKVIGCIFQNSKGDALDLDNVRSAWLRGNSFLDCGNDAVDISGTDAWFYSNTIERARDKGISVGERSRPLIVQNRIGHCDIGIAVKDESHARIRDCFLSFNKTGISLYRKKPMYRTGGTADMQGVKIINSQIDVQKDALSEFLPAATASTATLGVSNSSAGSMRIPAPRGVRE